MEKHADLEKKMLDSACKNCLHTVKDPPGSRGCGLADQQDGCHTMRFCTTGDLILLFLLGAAAQLLCLDSGRLWSAALRPASQGRPGRAPSERGPRRAWPLPERTGECCGGRLLVYRTSLRSDIGSRNLGVTSLACVRGALPFRPCGPTRQSGLATGTLGGVGLYSCWGPGPPACFPAPGQI
ncbi:hypothetical protein NDU88_007845 [Pleurodeles waltl]|uniref:Uncharacterized protein n=1 Tax=Pleurodeles waltl TaxID=8319 RepID=A0AAV7PMG5_PLEWA|nr:hypothetical protein NDU88_007845 [Pleurodeles waltl]